jgi:hypothetical protein
VDCVEIAALACYVGLSPNDRARHRKQVADNHRPGNIGNGRIEAVGNPMIRTYDDATHEGALCEL